MANPLMDHEIKALKEMGKIRQEAIDQMLVDDLMPNEWRLACQMVVRAFDAWMRAKPVDIGNTIRRNLITYRRTGNPVGPLYKHDAGNGAAMRILPVALAALGSTESTACAGTCHAQQSGVRRGVRVHRPRRAGLPARRLPPAHRPIHRRASRVRLPPLALVLCRG